MEKKEVVGMKEPRFSLEEFGGRLIECTPWYLRVLWENRISEIAKFPYENAQVVEAGDADGICNYGNELCWIETKYSDFEFCGRSVREVLKADWSINKVQIKEYNEFVSVVVYISKDVLFLDYVLEKINKILKCEFDRYDDMKVNYEAIWFIRKGAN